MTFKPHLASSGLDLVIKRVNPKVMPQTDSFFTNLNFDNSFTRDLPADPEERNFCRQVPGACYSRVQPVLPSNPKLVSVSKDLADSLEIDEPTLNSQRFVEVFSGKALLEDMDPFAMCYGGHQFGHWAGQLGDGRAINLGEIVTTEGQRWALQLKGAGPTPYSRRADGFAVLRSSVREYLLSEAMHYLEVPTTRALSLVTTGDEVVRDMFYDGNPKAELGAIVCRVAPTFLRFGNYQIFAARGEIEILKQITDYTLKHFFPHLGEPSKEAYVALFNEVCERTSEMIIHWMRVGFVHGVMNTDNMSILGQTIDYGPYGWLEDYDPNWTPNTTDATGRRYRFGHQGQIALWNLVQLANAWVPLIGEPEPLQKIIEDYPAKYQARWNEMMLSKLGLSQPQGDVDAELFQQLLNLLSSVETDMTLFFRGLAQLDIKTHLDSEEANKGIPKELKNSYYKEEELTAEYQQKLHLWLKDYNSRIQEEKLTQAERQTRMNRVNPKYVLRNYLAQLAIDKADKGDNSLVNELLEVLKNPYDEQPDHDEHAQKRPEWARNRPGCSMLSCSS